MSTGQVETKYIVPLCREGGSYGDFGGSSGKKFCMEREKF